MPVYVAETEARARAEPEESIMHFYRYLGAQLADFGNPAGARAIEQRAERGQRLQTIDYDEVLREKIIVGTPAMVADNLHALHDELGLNGILAEMNCGSRIPHAQVMDLLALLCRDVMPQFRPTTVIPAETGPEARQQNLEPHAWVPAFAGMIWIPECRKQTRQANRRTCNFARAGTRNGL